MRVLHLPTSVGGNSWGLAQAERALGVDSRVVYREQNWLQYPADIVLLPQKSTRLSRAFRLAKATLTIPQNYDVLHFNFGQTLFDFPFHNIDHWDLPLYRKQKLFVTYNGSDARMSNHRTLGTLSSVEQDRHKQRRIQNFCKAGASFFSLNPDLMWNLPEHTQFLPYTIANWDKLPPVSAFEVPCCLTVVHAPTNRAIKGTDEVIRACALLQKKYPGRIRLQLVEQVSHEEALELYCQADLVVDQLRIGWYGALAVEVMKMGKPVVVYIEPRDLRFLPNKMAKEVMQAVITANEDNLQQVLEDCLNRPEILRQKREAGLEYVYKWYDPLKVARITKNAYEKALEENK